MPGLVVPRFPDAEEWLTGYIGGQLPAHGVSDFLVDIATPATFPSTPVIVVNQDGGQRVARTIATARMRVRSWTAREHDSTDLALLLEALIFDAADGAPVTRVESAGRPSVLTDSRGDSTPGRVQWIDLHFRPITT